MLDVKDLQIKNQNGHILLYDISFSMPNQGIISICGDHDAVHHALAQVLAGICKPDAGSISYNEYEMHTFDEIQRSHYRSTFVISLFHNFQILKDRSVYQNITMGLEYPYEKIEQQLANWGLYDKKDMLAEDLSTREQWQMVLLRSMLRQPMMLIVDSVSLPLSSKEREEFYLLLEDLRSQVLVVILGDQKSYAISNRIIEIEKGHIITDSCPFTNAYTQINHNNDVFQLTRTNIADLQDKLHIHIRWKLRCASILNMIAFICLSTAIFSTTLNIVDIQSRLMSTQGSSIVAIEKVARANDDSIQNNYYATLDEQDIKELKKNIEGDFILGYYPVDQKEAMFYAYGTTIGEIGRNPLDEFTIMEAKDQTKLGLPAMIGEYPKNYNEIAMSSIQAYELLADELKEPYRNTEEQDQAMLYRTLSWFGNEMTITAIFSSQQSANINMELDMREYNGDVDASSMSSKTFFVKSGFHNQYGIFKDKTYQKSYKRLISGAQEISSFEHILDLNSEIYYYNGKEVVHDKALQEDEILIDFDLALDMGYRNTYLYTCDEDNNVPFKERVERYENFADNWIGKSINIQTYHVADHPINSTIMSENKTIKGFLIPMSYEAYKPYMNQSEQGSIYVKSDTFSTYESENVYLKEVFYHSDQTTSLKKALSYLNHSPDYTGYLFNSTILQFFVVDLKNLDTLLFALGSISFLVFAGILIFLLQSSSSFMREELTVYYLFGEKKSVLKKFIMQYFSAILWMRSLFGWLCGTLALGTFILIIYFTLSASTSILYSLALPLGLLLVNICIVKVAFALLMRNYDVIEKEFMDKG